MSTSTTTMTDPVVLDWLRDTAHPVNETAGDATGSDLVSLTDRIAPATVVGLGESTRFSSQTYGIRERIFRSLVREHGFRALAIQDSAASGARLDAYVRKGIGDPRSILAEAWRPWRTAEMVATLTWLRDYNEHNPDQQVAVFGIEQPSAEPSDYAAVLDYVGSDAPERLSQLQEHLAPIRTAHRTDEHIQRHQGIHPGPPFAEHAREALALLATLPTGTAHRDALVHARRIVDFHENSVAAQGPAVRDEQHSAGTIIDQHNSTGARIVYWDGTAHTAGTTLSVGDSTTMRFRGVGSYLRAHFGPRYLSVAISFHHGDLGAAIAPEPRPELVEAALGTVDLPAFYVDLRDEAPRQVQQWRRGPAWTRTISGVYNPDEDNEAKLAVSDLASAFDVLIHIRETTPVQWLPEFYERPATP